MKKELVKNWLKVHRRKIFCIVAVIVIIGGVAVALSLTSHKKAEQTKSDTIKEKVVEVDYLKYVKGLKDWTVQLNSTVNFMEGVEWDKKYVVGVMCDSSKVDITKEGKYDILYKVQALSDKDVDVTKTCTVEVISEAKADELAGKGEEVVTDAGIQNKKEAKASSITDKNVVVKSEGNKVEVSKDKDGNVSGSVDKPVSKPSNPSGGSSGKPSGGSSSGGNSKPSHSHKWEAITKEVYHEAEGHTEKELVKDAWEEKVKVKDAWEEKVKVKDAWEEEIYAERLVCKGCGSAFKTDSEMTNHLKAHFKEEGKLYSSESKNVVVDTIYHDAEYNIIYHDAEYEIINHPAEYRDVWVVDKEAWTSNDVVGYKCSCGAKK